MKPRVLHLIDSFRQGGSESQGLKLALAMDRSSRFDVELFCLDKSGPLLDKLDSDALQRVHEFKLNSFYDLNMCRQLSRLTGLIKTMRIQIVHTHDFYTNIFGGLSAARAGVPVRVASRRETNKRARHKRLIERVVYRAADAVIANCERVRRQLIAEGVSPRKVVTVYNGVATEAPRALNYAAAGIKACLGRPLVTIVANLRPVKDHSTFLRAAHLIAESRKDVSFAIAGEGYLEPELRRIAGDSGIASSVHFMGRVDDIPGLLRQSDVCVLTSKSEGFPNAVLEYMAAGKPVVSTDVGGINEAVIDRRNGFLVAPGDASCISRSVLWLLDHPAIAREMGLRGRSLIAERFSAQRQLDRVESLYVNLLTQRTGDSPLIF